jgi:hypothetical protein
LRRVREPAATELLREGRPPTVAEAAERALVSRATAYEWAASALLRTALHDFEQPQ